MLTIADWRNAYAEGANPAELLHALATRLAATDPAIWIHRATTAQIDTQVERLVAAQAQAGDTHSVLRTLPLFGVPFVVKDNIDIAGVPTTAACAAFAYVAPSSATAVQKLLDCGAVWMGKTNLDQFATGLVGTRSPWGRPSSALQPEYISGGSSSGSAVAVALGLVPFALGTDTAGSGRVPAAFNNIIGLKPTPGRISNHGVVPACRTLDCIAVFALVARDAAAVLAVMEGTDALDPWSDCSPASLPAPSSLRIGVPAEPDMNPGYRTVWAQVLQQLSTQGHESRSVDFAPLHAVAELLYNGPWVAERHTVVDTLLRDDPDALDPVVRKVIAGATRYTATDAFRARYALQTAKQSLNGLWQDYDVLMVPTTPEHPLFVEVEADPIGRNARLGRYTNFVNLLGWSAIALPAGMTSAGLPFGITLIAPAGHDALLAEVAIRWQQGFSLPLGATGMMDDGNSPPTAMPKHRASLDIAVVGAHLTGMPLNHQLHQAGARLKSTTTTAACYRLHALANTTPPKPGLERVNDGGSAIVVEVWTMPEASVGGFLAQIPPPLGLGNLELADGTRVKGFICEPAGLEGATDITAWGGWRAWVQSSRKP